jgi:hypothetical protein
MSYRTAIPKNRGADAGSGAYALSLPGCRDLQ